MNLLKFLKNDIIKYYKKRKNNQLLWKKHNIWDKIRRFNK